MLGHRGALVPTCRRHRRAPGRVAENDCRRIPGVNLVTVADSAPRRRAGGWTVDASMSSRVARPLRRNGMWTGLSGSCSCQPQNAPKRRISGASLGGSRPGGETPPPHGHVSVAIRGVPGGWAAGNGCPGVGLFVAPWDKYPARLRSAGETNTHQTFFSCTIDIFAASGLTVLML